MNGRVYDPVIAHFLSPDNNVQRPDNSQGFNRYSYCFNNPLIYTDPSGNDPTLDLETFNHWGDFSRYHHRNHDMDGKGGCDYGNGYAGGFGFGSFGGFGNAGGGGYGGGGGGYGGDPFNAMNSLLSSTYGGNWSSYSGTHYFKSDAESFIGGCAHIEAYNYWASTSGGSLTTAIDAYINAQNAQNAQDNYDNGLLACVTDPSGGSNPPVTSIWFYNLYVTNLNLKPFSRGEDILKFGLSKNKYFSFSLNVTSNGKFGAQGGLDIFGYGYNKSLYYSFLDDNWSQKENFSIPGSHGAEDDIWFRIGNLLVNLTENSYLSSDILMFEYKYMMNGLRQIKYPQEKYGFKVVF